MPRFYLNLNECGKIVWDEEGHALANIEAARLVAVIAARDIMASEIQRGHLCLGCCIIIEDDRRRELLRVPFTSAIETSAPQAYN